MSLKYILRPTRSSSGERCLRDLTFNDHWSARQNGSPVHVGINAGTLFSYASTQNLMTHNTSKFQIGGGLESADIGVLVRGVKNENFPCPARLRALKDVPCNPTHYSRCRFSSFRASAASMLNEILKPVHEKFYSESWDKLQLFVKKINRFQTILR